MTLRYAYFGHHKCASTWIHLILDEACKDMALRHRKLSNTRGLNGTLAEHVSRTRTQVLSYTNADFAEVERLGAIRGLHVIRDPRDVIVSAYFSHLKSHSTEGWEDLESHREALKRLPPEEGLKRELVFSERFLREMEKWDYQREGILQMKMEDLTADPYHGFTTIFQHAGFLYDEQLTHARRFGWTQMMFLNRALSRLGMEKLSPRSGTLPTERMLGIVQQNSFRFLSGGRLPGQENSGNHFRKGIAGDWKNHFTRDLGDVFVERYGDLLIQLGYERDHAWLKDLPETQSPGAS